MNQAFEVIGVDFEAETVVVEISRSILWSAAKALQHCRPTQNKSGVAVKAMGHQLATASDILRSDGEHRDRLMDESGFAVLEDEEERDGAVKV